MNTIFCLTTLKLRGHPTTLCSHFGFIVKHVKKKKLKRRVGGNINVKITFFSPTRGFQFFRCQREQTTGFRSPVV